MRYNKQYLSIVDIYFTVLTIILITYSESKFIAREYQSANLRQQKSWLYLDRMKVGPGQVSIQFWAYLKTQTVPGHNKYSLNLAIVPDYLWTDQLLHKCNTVTVQPASRIDKVTKNTINLPLNHNSRLSGKQELKLTLSEPTVIYLIVTDCSKSLVNQYFNKKSRFDIEVNVRNNGSNYGTDQGIYMWMIPLLISISSACIYVLNKYNNSNEYEDINWTALIVKIIVWTNAIGLGFMYFGYAIYVLGRGKDISFFSFVFLILSTLSQSLMLGLLTFCAYGWMTTFISTDNYQIYFPVATVAGFLSLVLSLLSKINDGSPQKTHIYDSIPNFIQIVIKIICLCVFLVGIVTTYLKNKNNYKLNQYLAKLCVLGIFAYCFAPLIIYCCQKMSIHERWVLVMICTQIGRTAIVVAITYQVAQKKSSYNGVTLHGKSFMQHNDKYM